jgi:hypothetical protein
MNKTNIEVQSKLKLIHDKLYFEDIYEEEKSYFVEFLCACLQASTGSGI